MDLLEIGNEELAIKFILFLEEKMEETIEFTPRELMADRPPLYSALELGENEPPTRALLCTKGRLSLVSGRSASLDAQGFKPYEDMHFNTQFAIAVTKALAVFHATLRARRVKTLSSSKENVQQTKGMVNLSEENDRTNEQKDVLLLAQSQLDIESDKTILKKDWWTNHISRSPLVSSNLSILCSHFKEENVSSRIVRKLEGLQTDIETFTKFLRFSSAMQQDSYIQSLGPICMCDVWVPKNLSDGEEEGDTLIFRLRGGPHLEAPPMRDVTWIWLTLLRPQVLRERYVELCESYCCAFNATFARISAPEERNSDDLTLYDIMRDLGDSFLHAFLTVVHRFTLSVAWSLDRQLHTTDGTAAIADAIGFLVDNGIIGSFFVM